MSDTLREDILKSEAGQRMVERVTPIYDDSYVGLWLYEAMGREWDTFWDLVVSLQTELYPETATWMLELWERRYGLTPAADATIEQRRQAVAQMRELPHPLSPYRLERYLESITGRTVNVIENVADYTFGISITGGDEDDPLDIGALRKYINAHKPSHMAYELFMQAATEITVHVETAYWRFNYLFCGTLPDINIEGGLGDGDIVVTSAAQGYKHAYPMAGQSDSGTLPGINMPAGLQNPALTMRGAGDAHPIEYLPCGVYTLGGGAL